MSNDARVDGSAASLIPRSFKPTPPAPHHAPSRGRAQFRGSRFNCFGAGGGCVGASKMCQDVPHSFNRGADAFRECRRRETPKSRGLWTAKRLIYNESSACTVANMNNFLRKFVDRTPLKDTLSEIRTRLQETRDAEVARIADSKTDTQREFRVRYRKYHQIA